jgi:hypothetical protein
VFTPCPSCTAAPWGPPVGDDDRASGEPFDVDAAGCVAGESYRERTAILLPLIGDGFWKLYVKAEEEIREVKTVNWVSMPSTNLTIPLFKYI